REEAGFAPVVAWSGDQATTGEPFALSPFTANMTGPMLRELAVQNLALIADARVELQPGFCAWTGETGAGKTLLLEALGLLLGERGSSALLRTGAEELRLTGRFELTRAALRREVERPRSPARRASVML